MSSRSISFLKEVEKKRERDVNIQVYLLDHFTSIGITSLSKVRTTQIQKGSPNEHILYTCLLLHWDTLGWLVCLVSGKLWHYSLITMLRFWCHSRNENAALTLTDILYCPHQRCSCEDQKETTLSQEQDFSFVFIRKCVSWGALYKAEK